MLKADKELAKVCQLQSTSHAATTGPHSPLANNQSQRHITYIRSVQPV